MVGMISPFGISGLGSVKSISARPMIVSNGALLMTVIFPYRSCHNEVRLDG